MQAIGHAMEILGVNSRSDMMSLRIECTKFGGEAPKKFEGTCGGPIFFIPKFALGNLLHEGFTIREISTMLAVSEYNLPEDEAIRTKFEFTDISDKDLDAGVEKVAIEFPYCGKNFIKHILFQKGFKVQLSMSMSFANSNVSSSVSRFARWKQNGGSSTSAPIALWLFQKLLPRSPSNLDIILIMKKAPHIMTKAPHIMIRNKATHIR